MIGHYKLGQVLGEGGFGTVYLAEQLEPVKRQVALKIIKLGMDTKEVIARFEAEKQALALMNRLETPGEKLFFTEDYGSNWENITGDLPNMPMGDLVIHPDNDDVMNLGTRGF